MLRMSELAANVAADAVASLLDGGRLELWSQDALLATATFPDPAFQPAREGEAISPRIGPVEGLENGAVVQFRAFTADGDPVLEGDIGPGFTVNGAVSESGPVHIDNFMISIGRH